MKSPRSAFFFIGRFDPVELANFNVQNVLLRDHRGGVIDVFGHSIAVWWPSQVRRMFPSLLDNAGGWLRLIAASYYVATGIALRAEVVAWVEALDVVAREAMIGVVDTRFHKVDVVGQEAAVNVPMRAAIDLARRLRRKGDLERAAIELLRAGNDPTNEAFLSAFRALECVRRIYEQDFARRKMGWQTMASDLAIRDRPSHRLLSDAAEAIRHGDVPPNRTATHPVNAARHEREQLMSFTRSVVDAAITKHAP